MVNNKEIKLLTELLDLEGIKVRAHRVHVGIGIILQVESIHSDSTCPRCGTKSRRLHQNHRYIVKDLPFGEKPVFLEINRRQFKCIQCRKPCLDAARSWGEPRQLLMVRSYRKTVEP